MPRPQVSSDYGATAGEDHLTSPYQLQENSPTNEGDGIHRSGGANDNWPAADDSSIDEDYEMSLTELLYSSASYHAIVKPVTLTMTLAALSVVYINDADTIAQGEAEMAQAYQVFQTDGSDVDSNKQKLELSFLNSFILVCGICFMTFFIVILYRFRFMKCLIAYMMFASSSLLGVLGGLMWSTAIDIYRWAVDYPTFYLGLWNFCLVGVFSIFYACGIPTYITQGYLVATSVILAWQLAHFDAFSTWSLLVMLALYDLCAVLTPCGPLKFLVHLMSQEDSPDMPGLLYEAELPPEARRPGVPSNNIARHTSDVMGRDDEASSTAAAAADDNILQQRSGDDDGIPPNVPMTTSSMEEEEDANAPSTVALDDPTVVVPLALARVYNLPILGLANQPPHLTTTTARGTPLLSQPEIHIPENPTPQQLKTEVLVRLPQSGGRIERIEGETRRRVFLERDRFGTPKRTVWVDHYGKVFAEAYEEGDEDGEFDQHHKQSNTIRLGLGDFIFYSVLVAKAAQYSFATFAACILVILAGLGGTLVLLSVYHHALPALPISIFLGVLFYLMTLAVIEPWIEHVLRKPYYV